MLLAEGEAELEVLPEKEPVPVALAENVRDAVAVALEFVLREGVLEAVLLTVAVDVMVAVKELRDEAEPVEVPVALQPEVHV